ncbi:DUF2946 family protein [Gayadomonas joobiniege]|uniref:DUF2946 family protein n=1 Tax=Gayadomonas joobiniege TaxID=1234606 RepID=UPI0009D95088
MSVRVIVKVLLLVAIVFQSYVAVSATMTPHQLDPEHLQTSHDHKIDNLSDIDSTQSHNVDDCHHCGHCSGHHTSWWIMVTLSTVLPLNTPQRFNPLVLSPHFLTANPYRPPIA